MGDNKNVAKPYVGVDGRMIRTMAAWIAGATWLAVAAPAAGQGVDATETLSEDAAFVLPKSDAKADEYGRKLFEAGRAAYDAGDYRQALDYFQRAYEMSKRPVLLYNVGQAADKLRLDKTALTAFELYLEQLPDADNRLQVEERIRVLKDVVAAQDARSTQSPLDTRVRLAQASAVQAASTRDPVQDDDLSSQWWLWAGAGAVVLTVVVVALAASSGTQTKERALARGTDGMVIATLGLEP